MRRPVLLGAAWTASAAAAIGLGFLAVSLVDASASPGTSPVAATTSSPAAPVPTATAPDGSVSGLPVPAASPTGEYATAGGTVFADCTSGSPVLAGVPATGWWVDPSDDIGKMEFENDDDDIDVHVACIDGAPRFALDDSVFRSSSSSSSSPSSSGPASPRSGWDDSDGRIGGGHGADD
ncbi:hypothetical protein [Blastococcus sp. SYSU DS0533]